MTKNKTLKEEIEEYLEKVGVPGIGYQVDWGRVTNEIIKLFDQKLKEQREQIIKEIEKMEIKDLQQAEELGYGGYDNQYSHAQDVYNQALSDILKLLIK